jgi:sugar lactone lactonase YvrE
MAATSAEIHYPSGVAVDSAGNLYIADTDNARIRKVSGGVITTVAGTGTNGYSGDGGAAIGAQISFATDVAVDSSGNLYIADTDNARIRKVSGGVITTVAGTGTNGYSGDSGTATSAQINASNGVAVDSSGNLYIADTGNSRIRKVSGGIITTVAGNGLNSYSGDGGQATNAQLDSPSALALDSSGNVYIADSGNRRIRVVSPQGIITTFTGGGAQGATDGILATDATLHNPYGLAAAGGKVYIEDNGLLRQVSAGVINTIAAISGGSSGFPGDGGVAVDGSGDIFVADSSASLVRKILPVSVSFISPSAASAGGPGFTLTVNGLNFANGDVVLWNGTTLPTTFVNSSRLQATVSSSLIAAVTPVCVRASVSLTTYTSCSSFTIEPSSCAFALDNNPYSIGTAGGALTAVLTATAGCSWTVADNYPGFVTIVSGGAGTGSGTINLKIAPNQTSSARTLSLQVGTAQIVINQTGPLQLITVAPCRIMDTRNANGPLGGPFIAGSTIRTIPIPSSACDVPANAVAYSLNITVVPRAGTLGYLSVWPAGQPQPLVSTLNSLDGSVLANAAIVPAGTSGAIDAYATNDTELIIDINGYFVSPATGTLQFYPLTPCRILDTRNPHGTFGGPSIAGGTSRSFPVPSSGCGVPTGAAAYSFNVTVVPQGPL